MKKLINAILVMLMLIVCLSSCGQKQAETSEDNSWAEPLTSEQKKQVIEKCINDYDFEDDKSFISTDESDWDIKVWPEYENMIVARCSQDCVKNPGTPMAVCAFVVTPAGLLEPKWELINWGDCVVESDEKDKYQGYLHELGYIDEYGNPL